MLKTSEPKIVLVERPTRKEGLRRRFSTAGQAKFYLDQTVGRGSYQEYEDEDAAYRRAKALVIQAAENQGILQIVDREFLPNFQFGPDDTVIALGQDGLVANTLKYLLGQPLIGVNPDPRRFDGVLLPFEARDVAKVLPEVLRRRRGSRSITMALALLHDGQKLLAVNDLFLGPKSHTSARYELTAGERTETQSSSGLIVSTGLGATGWLKSLLIGAAGITGREAPTEAPAWEEKALVFTVREPFPSRHSQASIIHGRLEGAENLRVKSLMPESGVIFSDGIEADFLDFNSGALATIGIAPHQGKLIQ